LIRADPSERLTRAWTALEGLSVGDGFGERFFVDYTVLEGLIEERAEPTAPWPYTDDTEMALSIVASLVEHERIDQDYLAREFAGRYDAGRGYGPAMHRILRRIGAGEPWRVVAGSAFEGQGSYGNGAAMRSAPLGAYFADDLDAVAEQARRSAEVTHAHPEGIAGAVAVAAGAAWACRLRGAACPPAPAFLERVLESVPESEVRERIRRARDLPPSTSVGLAVAALGNGTKVSAQDTVPFALWCAAQRLEDFVEAMWLTVSGLRDRDTTCAIVGGIVAGYVGRDGIPADWRAAREPLPTWARE
jgi:ADP-ribosylglycohydrolase